MLLKGLLILTLCLLVITKKFRVLDIMYVQLWEFALFLSIIVWSYHKALSKTIHFRVDSLNIALIIFLIINVFSSIRMPEHAGSFMKGGLWYNLRTVEPVLLYILLRDYFSSRSNIKPFIHVILGALFIECLLALTQSLTSMQWSFIGGSQPDEQMRGYIYYFTGIGSPVVSPVTGTFEHFNEFGFYLSIFVPLIVSFGLSRAIAPSLTISLLTLNIAALLLTYSRGALLGTAIGLSVMGIISLRRKPFLLFLSLVFVLAATAVVLQLFVSKGYEETLNLSARVEIWEKAFDVISKNPINFIFGTGSGTHLYWTQYEAEGHYYSPHNAYLMFWLETGLIGLLSFLSITFIFFLKMFRTFLHSSLAVAKAVSLSMLGIGSSLLVQQCFQIGFAEHATKALVLTVMALSMGISDFQVRKQ